MGQYLETFAGKPSHGPGQQQEILEHAAGQGHSGQMMRVPEVQARPDDEVDDAIVEPAGDDRG